MKRFLSFLLAAVMASSLLVLPAGAADVVRFSDVTDRRTSVAVESLRLMGVLDGYDDGTFRPNAPVNRAQFCKMAVYAMGGTDEMGLYNTITVFPDVKPSHWASGYINMVSKKGIISGYPDGRFHPERTVTVGQAVTVLLRLLGYKDEDIGGIWPASYMSEASTIGLTERISMDGNAPLTRSQAAELFLNLLRANTKEGTSYISSIGAWTFLENEILLTSSAVGDDGRASAMRLTSAASMTYEMAGNKVSNGVLDGCRGTLLLNKRNKVITFIPADVDQSTTVTVSYATATQITDITGKSYRVDPETWTYYNGQVLTWSGAQSGVFSWITAGTTVTLYMDIAGKVDRILVGGGTTSSSAVIVYDDQSTAGFGDLTEGSTDYKIYKNGMEVTAKDMRKYDVATYSPTTNSIRVCDTRLSGFYEGCSPNPSEPAEITLMGHTFQVLSSAQEMLSKFKPGDQITILLTEDNQVAGAVEARGDAASNNAVGIAEVNGETATVELLCGIKVSGTLSQSNADQLDGQLVRVGSTGKGRLSITRLSSGAAGDLDVEGGTLGVRKLAANVMVFEIGSDGAKAISLSQLSKGTIPSEEISYARVNWAGKVDMIVLGTSVGSVFYYGRAIYEDKEDTGADNSTLTVEAGAKTYGPYTTGYKVKAGGYVGISLTGRGNDVHIAALVRLNEIKDVSNNSWIGENSVIAGGRTYSISNDILCYNRDTRSWVTLSEAHAYANKCNLYTHNGQVRIIEVGR